MKRLISLTISLLILAVIYWEIDFAGLVQVFQNCDRLWIVMSLGMVVPLVAITSWRLKQRSHPYRQLSISNACRQLKQRSHFHLLQRQYPGG